MTSPGDQIIVGLGEVLWDCFAEVRRPGGAPANVAFHAGQLGHKGVIYSRVGDDRIGCELRDFLAAHNLDVTHLQVDRERRTGCVVVDTICPERPSYHILDDAAWDQIEFNKRTARLMGSVAAVCFGTLAQRTTTSREAIHLALAAAKNALLVYDVNLREPWYEPEWIERSLHAAHIAKLNFAEAAVLGDLLDLDASTPASFGENVLRRYDVELVCITRAGHGCVLVGDGQTVDIPGTSVQTADAVGAGDAFTAALNSARLRGWSPQVSAAFANQMGALVASRTGAMPDLTGELPQLVSRMMHAHAARTEPRP